MKGFAANAYEYGVSGGFGGNYPLGDPGSFGEAEGFGQEATTTPAPVPTVIVPAPVSLTQQLTGFLKSPFGIMALIAGSLFVLNYFGYIDIRKMFEITSKRTKRRRRTY